MKRTFVYSGLALALAGIARADFDPIPLTPASFTADVVVENTAAHPLQAFITASMDGGTNGTGATWFEMGINSGLPAAGLPAAGTMVNAVDDANHQFRMPASYSVNNAVFLRTDQNPTGSLTLSTPTVLTTLSVMGSSGGGAVTVDYIIHHQDGSVDSGTLTCPDWYNNSPIAVYARGRLQAIGANFQNLYDVNPRLAYIDLPVSGSSPVTRIDFNAPYGGGRACIMGLSGETTPGGGFSPLDVTGFNADMVIEAAAEVFAGVYTATTATMDGGTNNNSNVWFEQGLNTGNLNAGLPPAGTTFAAVSNANYSFTMPSSYVGNNAVLIASIVPNGTLTLDTPVSLTGLSFLASFGGGGGAINYTVHFQDGSADEVGSVNVPDWYNGEPTTAWISDGRFNTDNGTFNAAGNPRLNFNDITLANTTSLVTSIDFSYGSGGRCSIFALSGQASGGGAFAPLAVTGFDYDMVVEKVDPVTRYTAPRRMTTATTVSMDGGTNNNGNTWYEQGFFPPFPNSGLPAAGSTFTSQSLPDHHYQMPTSYSANNCVFVDTNHPVANITPAMPAGYSALSFLSACAHGRVTNQCIMQYEDGTTETNQFVSQDWFNNAPYAFSALGRVNLDDTTFNNDPTRTTTPNPRLYEAQFFLNSGGSVNLTNVLLTFVGSQNANGLMAVLAVSGTTGPVAPIIRDQPASVTAYEGSNVVLSVTIDGGTPPITYQWQVNTGGGFVDVADDAIVSGATSTTLSFTGITYANQADYRFVATGPSLSSTSAVVTVTVLSVLPDVTQPTDPFALYQPDMTGGVPPAAEDVDKAIDNTTSKYLNRGAGTTPFSGGGGLTVTPLVGGTIVEVVRLYTANDAEGRDPADFLLEGSNDGGANYATIASGSVAMPSGRNAGALAIDPLTQRVREIRFANATSYTSYRFSVNSVKGNESLMQFGEVELLGTVAPNAVPTVTLVPTDTTVNEGTTATFTVAAIGPGPIGYQWYDVTGGEPGTPVAGGNSATLSLPAVTAAMSGNTYRVAVTNANGSVTSPATILPGAQLTVVSGPPTIVTDLPTEGVVYVGRTAVLSVGISGTEPFTLQWQKNGADLSDTARITGSQSNVLTIANAQAADSGNYQLAVITNSQGQAQSAVQALTVQKIPAFTATGGGWALNGVVGTTPFPATMIGGVLEVTAGIGDTRRSAWYTAPLYIGAFKASFTYQDIGGGGADGIAFVLHNAPAGATALGGGGGGLGYSGITPSVALQFNIFGTAGIAFNTNGNTGGYSPTSPVNVASGDPIRTEITYVAGVASVVLSNTTTAVTFAADLPVGDLEAALGMETAFVGFTGADGGTASTQDITEFQYIPLPTLTAQTVGGAVVLSWPASIGGFEIQSATSVTSPAWGDAGLTPTIVGDQYQATVATSSDDTYFRLVITVP